MDVLLAEKVKVGEPEFPGFETACDPQPLITASIMTAEKKKLKNRSVLDFIRPWPLGSKLNKSDSELRAGVAPAKVAVNCGL